jgi:hypothetical protein
MEAIGRVTQTGPAIGLAGRRASQGTGFSIPAESDASASAAAHEADGVAETSQIGLLALQEEAAGDTVRDRAARRRGFDLLSELAALQRDLLGGGLTGERLERLAGLAEQIPDAADPGLREAVAAIALRARVEVARYGTR